MFSSPGGTDPTPWGTINLGRGLPSPQPPFLLADLHIAHARTLPTCVSLTLPDADDAKLLLFDAFSKKPALLLLTSAFITITLTLSKILFGCNSYKAAHSPSVCRAHGPPEKPSYFLAHQASSTHRLLSFVLFFLTAPTETGSKGPCSSLPHNNAQLANTNPYSFLFMHMDI